MRFAAAAAFFGAALAIPNVAELQERQAAGGVGTILTTAVSTVYTCPNGLTSCAATATTVPVLTTSIVYDILVHTIFSCGTSVTNCPATLSTQTINTYTTICPVTAALAAPTTTTVAPVVTSSVYVAPVQYSYVTYTTCIPSTGVSTITITPTPTPAPAPIVSAAPTIAPNGTFTYTGPTQTGNSANAVSGSLITAAAAALAAFLFA